jgi:hypothetical protein
MFGSANRQDTQNQRLLGHKNSSREKNPVSNREDEANLGVVGITVSKSGVFETEKRFGRVPLVKAL